MTETFLCDERRNENAPLIIETVHYDLSCSLWGMSWGWRNSWASSIVRVE